VVALIVVEARAACAESRRLRSDSAELKLLMRSNARLTEARMTRALAAAAVGRARRVLPMASPWSSLTWLREDEELNRVLVSID
jgi:hypothetical protein